jgi:FkbH-like protein
MGIEAQLQFTPYNQLFQQLISSKSLFNENHGGINVLFLRLEDGVRDLKNQSPELQVSAVRKMVDDFICLTQANQSFGFAICFVCIVPPSGSPELEPAVSKVITELNDQLKIHLDTQARFHLFDLDDVRSFYQVEAMFHLKLDKEAHIPFSEEMYAALGTYLARMTCAWKCPPYKMIVVDCDNTLWRGICGELNPDDVVIDDVHAGFQEFLFKKYTEGFLLAICSKNNEEDVWAIVERNSNMIIKRQHIAGYRINWKLKSENLLELSREMNIATDAMIFIDDDPVECESMSVRRPEVLSIHFSCKSLSDVEGFSHIWAFDRFFLTNDDRQRNPRYSAEKSRNESLTHYDNVEEFIDSLNIQVQVYPLGDKDIKRAVQLMSRTNQFNMNGFRKTEEEMHLFIRKPDAFHWGIDVKDRFGEYGFTGLILADVNANALKIETFLLSCRVLGRNVEHMVMEELKTFCERQNIDSIDFSFKYTGKNTPFRNFFQSYQSKAEV